MKTTYQGLFDQAVKRFRDGTGRAWSYEHSQCMYETEEGNHCVVGDLLKNSKGFNEICYSMKSIEELSYMFEHILPAWVSEKRDFLSSLQAIHDDESNWDNLGGVLNESGEAKLRRVARDYILNYSPPAS